MTRKSKARFGMQRTYRVRQTVKAMRQALLAATLVSAASLAAPPERDVAIFENVPGDATIVNDADVYADAQNIAGGLVAVSYTYGNASISNTGAIVSHADAATYGNYGDSVISAGIYTLTADGDSMVDNAGDITAVAVADATGTAIAFGVASYAGYGQAEIDSAGDIIATARADQGSASAIAINAVAATDVLLSSVGELSAAAYVDYAMVWGDAAEALALSAQATSGNVQIDNNGDLFVTAALDNSVYAGHTLATATGIQASADYGNISIGNVGTITLQADNGMYLGETRMLGIGAEAYNDISIVNNGDIGLTGSSGGGYYYYNYYNNYAGVLTAYGINAQSENGLIQISNSGNIRLTDANAGSGYQQDVLFGISASSVVGEVTISNSGDIDITGGGTLAGVRGYTQMRNYTQGGGDVIIDNTGNIQLATSTDGAFAVGVEGSVAKYGGNVVINNSGDIQVSSTGEWGHAVGINGWAGQKYAGDVMITNSGDIHVEGTRFAYGIQTTLQNGTAIITNTGDITAQSQVDDGNAIDFFARRGSAVIYNSGNLVAHGGFTGSGIDGAALYSVSVTNHGDIDSDASNFYGMYNSYYGEYYYLGGNAFGISVNGVSDYAHVYNTGNLTVHGEVSGYGIYAGSRYGNSILTNSGDVNVVGERHYAYGLMANGVGFTDALYGYGSEAYSVLDNSGDVQVSGYSFAIGLLANQGYGTTTISNSGAISVTAAAGRAFGIAGVSVLGAVNITNSGDVDVQASGNAHAVFADSAGYGNSYYGYTGDIAIDNSGALVAVSEYGRASAISTHTTYGTTQVINQGDGNVSGYDRSVGIDSNSTYGDVLIYNTGALVVDSSMYSAAGIRAMSVYGDVAVINTNDITVAADQLTQGLLALSYQGGAVIVNAGDVSVASANGYAQAVAIRSGTGSAVINYGTITADDVAISATGAGLYAYNNGVIHGGVLADAGDDVLINYGQWYLSDDSINLYAGSNAFYNGGELFVDGSANVVDLGGSGSVFHNNGNSIHMEDGAADDSLLIVGDFTGTGGLYVDVDGATLSSDLLLIDGDVLPGTANTVDINLLSLPSAADILAGMTIPVVGVTGSADADAFTLGQVSSSNSALFSVDYSLQQSGSEFALGLEITGLSTAGVLLTSLSPAVQNFWQGSVGTLYQRQGVERGFAADGAWFRMYGGNGGLSPNARRSNFGNTGSQDFDFNNNGMEVGIGHGFGSAWSAGIFGGQADGNVSPDVGGKIQMDGTTLGAYVSYLPGNGWYADLSYRQIDIKAVIRNGSENLRSKADADGLSLELGYGFASAGGIWLEPQFQYSTMKAKVDPVAYDNGDFSQLNGASRQWRAGVSARKTYSQDGGQWTPYAALSYKYESAGSNRYEIDGVLNGAVDISGGSALLEAGTDAQYGAWRYNLGVSMQDGGAYQFTLGAQASVRYTW